MARRVHLPRLTQRQRMSRWQRERRQQTIIVAAFSAVLLFVLGAALWASTTRYHERNLVAAATIEGQVIPQREYERELRYQLVRFFSDFGVPPEFEDDPRLAQDKQRYESSALEAVVEQRVLDRAARAGGVAVGQADIDLKYEVQYGEFKTRHILIAIPQDAEDPELAAAIALAKARGIANELKAHPSDQDRWNRIAETSSDDPGSKFSGGELGFAGTGQFVREFEDAIRTLSLGQVSDPVKSQFGYHVIQLQERRAPDESELVREYLARGYTLADLREHARYDLLREQFTRRAEAEVASGAVEQVRLAQIVVSIPLPSLSTFEDFGAALQKLSDVRTALEEGRDFAEVATELSDDGGTKDKGGEVGWIPRGVLTELRAEDQIFATAVGERTEYSASTHTSIFKVLEKDPARELTEEQKKTLTDRAYQYWLARQKQVYDVQKLVPFVAD